MVFEGKWYCCKGLLLNYKMFAIISELGLVDVHCTLFHMENHQHPLIPTHVSWKNPMDKIITTLDQGMAHTDQKEVLCTELRFLVCIQPVINSPEQSAFRSLCSLDILNALGMCLEEGREVAHCFVYRPFWVFESSCSHFSVISSY